MNVPLRFPTRGLLWVRKPTLWRAINLVPEADIRGGADCVVHARREARTRADQFKGSNESFHTHFLVTKLPRSSATIKFLDAAGRRAFTRSPVK
jgi:hypothetical protein